MYLSKWITGRGGGRILTGLTIQGTLTTILWHNFDIKNGRSGGDCDSKGSWQGWDSDYGKLTLSESAGGGGLTGA